MKIMGVLDQIGIWCFQAHVKDDEIQMRLAAESPAVFRQAQYLRVSRTEIVPESLRSATHSGKLCTRFRGRIRRVMWGKGELVGGGSKWGLDLAVFTAYSCAEDNLKEATVARNVMAANVYHGQWARLALPPQHFRTKAVIKRDPWGGRGGYKPDEGKKSADVRVDEGDREDARRLGCGEEESVDRPGRVVSAAAEDIETVRSEGEAYVPGSRLD